MRSGREATRPHVSSRERGGVAHEHPHWARGRDRDRGGEPPRRAWGSRGVRGREPGRGAASDHASAVDQPPLRGRDHHSKLYRDRGNRAPPSDRSPPHGSRSRVADPSKRRAKEPEKASHRLVFHGLPLDMPWVKVAAILSTDLTVSTAPQCTHSSVCHGNTLCWSAGVWYEKSGRLRDAGGEGRPSET
jgi:hypothetical protein